MTPDGTNPIEDSKAVADSQVTMGRQMMPDDANPWGDVHGGVIMKMVDEAAGAAATRHARSRVATAAIDYMSFLHPVHVGDFVVLKASVNDVGRTSMEVGVRVESENMLTGERNHTSSAYVVMVGLDAMGRPTALPRIDAYTRDEKRRMAAAKIRRSQRKALEAIVKASDEALRAPTVEASELIEATRE
jgi:acyl-CoA hydrolase